MADISNGTQFSDLPSYLVIEILVRLPMKALLICRYVRKDWTLLYFSDSYFIRRQLETPNIHHLTKYLSRERKLQFGWFVDEVRTGKLRIETFYLSCNFLNDRKYDWCVVNSCNGLVCLIEERYGPHGTSSRIYVCNPILKEWVIIPLPNKNSFHACALGFSAKNNRYKVLLCIAIADVYPRKYEWKIYTLGTKQWRSIDTKENTEPWRRHGPTFNTFIHGSLHWTCSSDREGVFVVQSFNFETERFTVLSILEPDHEPEKDFEYRNVTLGVINGCLWASFYHGKEHNGGEMWAMKEYGVDKPWTTVLLLRDTSRIDHEKLDEAIRARDDELVIYEDKIYVHNLLLTFNGDEMLIWSCLSTNSIICYNINTKTKRRRQLPDEYVGCGTAYNPSFVSLHDVARGEEVIS